VHGWFFIFILTTILKSYACFDEGIRSYGPGISLRIPDKIRSPAYNHDFKTINDLVILHVHKERVDRLDLDKIAENYVSGRKDTLRKLG